MGVKDPVKNREYVARHRAKKREEMGDEAYKKEHAKEVKIQRDKQKEDDEEEFKRKNREYMAEYRKDTREAKKGEEVLI